MRTFREIALEIKVLWKNPQYEAAPYLDALMWLDTTDKNAIYIVEKAKDIVAYLLCSLTYFRGADARRIKQELKDMIK